MSALVRRARGSETGFFCDQRDNRRLILSARPGTGRARRVQLRRGIRDRRSEGRRAVGPLPGFIGSRDRARAAAARGQWRERPRRPSRRRTCCARSSTTPRKSRTFDVVILDPPKLVHRLAELNKGLRLYFEINYKAAQVLNDGGILVTCSCSQHVRSRISRTCSRTWRRNHGVAAPAPPSRAQPPDHPMMLPHAESRYLKCHVYRVVGQDRGFSRPAVAFEWSGAEVRAGARLATVGRLKRSVRSGRLEPAAPEPGQR